MAVTCHDINDNGAPRECARLFTKWFGLDLYTKYAGHHGSGGIQTILQPDAPVSVNNVHSNVKIIRAPMGSGKTAAMISWLKTINIDSARVLVISCRRSFAEELLCKFETANLGRFRLYSDVEEYSLTENHIIIQIESLYRLDGCYDILILDEVVSIINQFYSSTMRHLREVDDRFISCIASCTHLLAMDATINEPLINFLTRFKGSVRTSLILNSYVGDNFSKRRAIFLSCFTCDVHTNFMKTLLENLLDGKRICVFASTAASACFIADEIRTHFPQKKILRMTGKDKLEKSELWDSYDVIVYNTVITVGISFEKQHFHMLFVYIHLFRNGPDMMSVYQSIGRVRYLLDQTMYIYMNPIMVKKNKLDGHFSLFPSSVESYRPIDLDIIERSIEEFKSKCTLDNHDDNVINRGQSLSVVRDTFKIKYILEKTVLNNFSDSFTLLYLLLRNNKITVVIDDEENGRVTSESFFNFIRTTVTDCKPLSQAKVALHNIPYHPDFIRTVGRITECIFSDNTPLKTITNIVKSLRYENVKHSFINSLCHHIVRKGSNEDMFFRAYDLLCNITVVSDEECNYTYTLNESSVMYDAHFSLSMAKLGREITTDMRLKSCTDVSSDVPESHVVYCAVKYGHRILNCLQCAFNTHIQCFESLGPKTMKLYYALKGISVPMLCMKEYCIILLKTWFKLVYDMSIVRCAPRYVTETRSSRLTKAQIITELDKRGICYNQCKTHRQLRDLLRSSNVETQRDSTVYKLRGLDLCSLFSDRVGSEDWLTRYQNIAVSDPNSTLDIEDENRNTYNNIDSLYYYHDYNNNT
ncbi:origin binding protein [Elephant endotheliotropic herpesvirus 5B]|uniref:Replication origin-binding protein n=3 Tax=Elephant endotheliotropic herpesvirus 5 TaxID=768738 RepID=A0A075CZU1_9BETA|nr:DNA replication origin-binding helicase [Elephant endotheliotropic herpesvirus 5]AHC02864.1 DNA replication origin-binding helicase [Elephant endotheliotropic herpesvirus 5]UVZ35278.1 origin binding protein [Elephant endotheliotropic herpesvirus 5B]